MNIANNLLPDERIIFRTKKSVIVFFVPFVFVVIALLFSLDFPIPNAINTQVEMITAHLPYVQGSHNIIAIFFLILAAYASIRPALLYIFSEYVVTNKRIMTRRGFFDRVASDTRLATISHVTVDQGPLGQIMNFGNVSIFGFGGTDDRFTQIANPGGFQKSVHSQLDLRAPA